MPSGAKKRKAAKKKNNKGGGGGPNNNNNNNKTNYYPSSIHSQGEDDSKSQEDRESDTSSPLSQERNDHEYHPFDQENVASERSDRPFVASDLTGRQISNAEDPAGGNIVAEDDERLVEVNILNSGAVDGSATSERKQEEYPPYALSTEATSGIEEKALHSLAKVPIHILGVEKAVGDEHGCSRVESVPTEDAGFEQVMPPVEVDKSLKNSANDDNEEKGIDDAYIEERDVNPSFGEVSTQILIAKRSVEGANGDVDGNPASKVDWDTPVAPMSDVSNSVIDSVHSVEVLEVVECRLSNNEDKELQDPSKVNGTLPTVNGKEGRVFPLEEDNVETSLDEGKTLPSANEVFPLVNENGRTSPDEVDAVIANEDTVSIVTKEKEDGLIRVVDDMIKSSTVAANATEIVNEVKTKTPGAGLVDNASTVEASDVTVKGKNEDTLLKLTGSGTENDGIDKNKKDSSVSAGTQHPVARASGLWALLMNCFGISHR